nr:hypothetical protein [Tanacetum cinerariifolium]
MRPFGCPVTILNTFDPLGKFQGKVDEGFLVGYFVCSKAFRVFNIRTRNIQETLHVSFLENKPNVACTGPTWLFDIDSLTRTMNYQPVTARNQTNSGADAAFDGKEHDFDATKPESVVILSSRSNAQLRKQDDKTKKEDKEKSHVESFTGYRDLNAKFKDCSDNSSNEVNAIGSIVPTVGHNSLNSTNTFSVAGPSNTDVSPTYGKSSFIDASQLPDDPDMLELDDITYSDNEDVVGAEADFNNLESSIPVSPILTTSIHKDHPVSQIIGDMSLTTQTRSVTRVVKDQGFEDPNHYDKVYKVVKALYGLHQAPRACQDKYVAEILRKFGLTEGKSASTPIDTDKPLLKDPDGEDIDVHTYRSMIGSLIYLTSSRPDIMFAVCACVRFQVTPKASHLHAVKRIFRYLKGKPHLGLWYLKDSSFDLVAYSDSDYAGTSLDRKSTTRGCQFFRCRLISWQCKKQTVVATSSTEAEYVATASCCTQTNDVTRLQALVDRKKVVIMEAAIRDSMSAKRTSWNEFSSAMASAVICLSIGRRFNFSKYIFESLVRNVDSTSKFYMYPRFIQLLIRNQLGNLLTHTTKYTFPALTQKVFANTRRVGKGFSGVETPLFKGMLVARVIEEEALDACAALTRRVEHLEYDKVAQGLEILKLKKRVKKLEKGNKVKVIKLRRLKNVGTSQRIDTSEDTVMEDASNHGRLIDDLDKDDVVALMDDKEKEKKEKEVKDDQEDEPAEVQEVLDVVTTAKLITEVVNVASETITAASKTISAVEPQVPAVATTTAAPVRVVAASIKRRKGVVIRDPEEESTIIIPADTKSKDKGKVKFNSNVDFILKTKEQTEEEERRVIRSINETPAQKAAKRRRLNEKVEDLKRHLDIMPSEDYDVYTEATPLARKVPVVDYEIIHLNNKPHYKIIRADGTHQLTAHGQAKVKSWKLLESCGVHIITFTTTQLILLVERRYPLSRFTLDQMLNTVRLKVEEQSKISLDLLRFTRQQHQEGQLE